MSNDGGRAIRPLAVLMMSNAIHQRSYLYHFNASRHNGLAAGVSQHSCDDNSHPINGFGWEDFATLLAGAYGTLKRG